MSENKKEFNTKLYAVIVFIVVAAILATTTVVTFKTKYVAFHPDQVAQNYVDNIVQKGDGYDAYKYTLVSKNSKFGDFIIENYMKPYVNDGENVKLSKASQDEQDQKGDGKAKEKFYDTMYKYYVNVVHKYGYDDYDSIFKDYFKECAKQRKAIYKDDYMSTEVMFGVFEANVATYGDSLTGTEDVYDENTKVKISSKSTGVYQKLYGDDYKITCTTTSCKALSNDEKAAYIKTMNTDMLKTYEVSTNDIKAVDKCTVTAKLEDGKTIAEQELYCVQIGNSWYVDNTTVNTSNLYVAK